MNPQYDRTDCSNNDAPPNLLPLMIVKLRWMGLDDKAKQLELEACRLPAEQRCGVSCGPFSTD